LFELINIEHSQATTEKYFVAEFNCIAAQPTFGAAKLLVNHQHFAKWNRSEDFH
jgi:hypothetical protein